MKYDREELIRIAAEAGRRAYAPESSFHVGAVVLASSGKIYTGCNVENVSHGISICAERVAVHSAVAAGERSFEALAVIAGDGNVDASPCGACRQVLIEFSPGMIVIYRHEGETVEKTAAALLPDAFSRKDGDRG